MWADDWNGQKGIFGDDFERDGKKHVASPPPAGPAFCVAFALTNKFVALGF